MSRVKTGGRSKGTPNKNTVDQRALQEFYMEKGYKSIAEIAFLMANDAHEEMEEVREEMGVNSTEYDLAHKRASTAVKTALPYFTTQIKAIVVTDDENFSEEAIAAKAKAILEGFKR